MIWSPPARLAQRFAAELPQVLVAEPDSAGIGLRQPHDHAAESRFAGAGLADHRQRLAFMQRQRDAVGRDHLAGRLKPAALDAEGFAQLDDVEQRRGAGRDFAVLDARLRNRVDQLAGVGLTWVAQHLLDGAVLDHLAVAQHDDAIGDIGHDAEIMGDEQYAHAALAPEVVDQAEDLALGRDIERGRRLVRDQERRLVRHSHSDHDALALASGQFERIAVGKKGRVWQADLGQELLHPGLDLGRRRHGTLVREDRLFDLFADALQRIERRQWFLEDHGGFATAQTAQRTLVECRRIVPCDLYARPTTCRRLSAAARGSHARSSICRNRIHRRDTPPRCDRSRTIRPRPRTAGHRLRAAR